MGHFNKMMIWGFALAFVFTAACSPDQISVIEQEEEASEPSELSLLLENPERIGFAQVKQWAFKQSCNRCHNSESSAGGIDLSNYEALMSSRSPNLIMLGEPKESRLYTSLEATRGSRKMPPEPSPQISESQRKLVYEWIARGAPKNPGETQAFLSLEERLKPYFENPKIIDYEVVQKWVFEPGRCYNCHSREGYRADPTAILFGADMTRYSDVFLYNGIIRGQPTAQHNEVGDLVAMGSRIFQAVAEDQTMPPQEEGYFPLSELRIELLRLWILNCAIETYDPNQETGFIFQSMPSDKVRTCYEF